MRERQNTMKNKQNRLSKTDSARGWYRVKHAAGAGDPAQLAITFREEGDGQIGVLLGVSGPERPELIKDLWFEALKRETTARGLLPLLVDEDGWCSVMPRPLACGTLGRLLVLPRAWPMGVGVPEICKAKVDVGPLEWADVCQAVWLAETSQRSRDRGADKTPRPSDLEATIIVRAGLDGRQGLVGIAHHMAPTAAPLGHLAARALANAFWVRSSQQEVLIGECSLVGPRVVAVDPDVLVNGYDRLVADQDIQAGLRSGRLDIDLRLSGQGNEQTTVCEHQRLVPKPPSERAPTLEQMREALTGHGRYEA